VQINAIDYPFCIVACHLWYNSTKAITLAWRRY